MDQQRILYFDIDGVILDYDERVKHALRGGQLQAILQEKNFDHWVCVSGWSSMALDGYFRRRRSL